MPVIAMLVFPGVQALDVSGPLDVFAEANRFLPAAAHYELHVIGSIPGMIACSNGMQLLPQQYYADVAMPFDLLLVAGGPDLPMQPPDPALSAWLCTATARARRFGSICNGAFLLGHAGLLAGKIVTTHWNDSAALAAMFPAARVDADRIFLRDGKLYTSAGVTAGIDLSLHLLLEDAGPEVSLQVAKRLVVFTQRYGGQSQFSPFLTPHRPADAATPSPVAQVQQHVLAHLGDDLTVDALARQAGMSARNFARVFARDAGVTPAEFIESARLDAARVLLEASQEPLKTIAWRCGFRNRDHLRAVFVKRLGLTAMQYRSNFAGFNLPQTLGP